MSSLSHKLSTQRISLKSFVSYFSFSALTLLIGWREGPPMRIKTTRLLMFVNTHGEGTHLFSWVSHTPVPWERSPSAPQFLGFSCIYAYTLWHRMTKFSVVKHTGEAFQPRRCVLHKWVARYLSDSWVSCYNIRAVERFQQIVSSVRRYNQKWSAHISGITSSVNASRSRLGIRVTKNVGP